MSLECGLRVIGQRVEHEPELPFGLTQERMREQHDIDAHAASEATLAYVNPAAPAPIGQLCVDIASLAQQTPAQWRCFGNPEAVAQR